MAELENTDVAIDTEEKTEITEPSMYRVIFWNDDKTTFEFVMYALVKIFNKTTEDAAELTLEVHTSGKSVVGIYSHEIAEQKTEETLQLAKANQFPLRVTYEKDT